MTVTFTLIPLRELGPEADENTFLVFRCDKCILKIAANALETHAKQEHHDTHIVVDTRERPGARAKLRRELWHVQEAPRSVGTNPLITDPNEWMNPNGELIMLCVACELDDEILESRQALAVYQGHSLCREHLMSWNQFGIFQISSTN